MSSMVAEKIAEANQSNAISLLKEEKAVEKPVKPAKVMVEGRRTYTTHWNKEENKMVCSACNNSWTPKTNEEGTRLIRGQHICPNGCCKK